LHLEGLARKRGRPIQVMHVAEILAASLHNPENAEIAEGPNGPR
jgi:hypothetical protein